MIVWPLLAAACQVTDAEALPGVATTELGAPGFEPVANAPVPFGLPRPVGPSKPDVAVHRYVPLQVPFVPLVTSLSWLFRAYG